MIQGVQRPTLVIAHNKTLAAQLCGEFREFFPDNAVEYFVSYYDYYQPEAYVPQTDTYIEKDSSLNEEIDKLRHSATASIFERRDVIIVASVSCIYGLGSPEDYRDMMLSLRQGRRSTGIACWPSWSTSSTPGTTTTSPAALPGAGGCAGDLPGLFQREGVAGGVLRRRDGAHPGDRHPDRRDAVPAPARRGLSGVPLRDAPERDRAGAIAGIEEELEERLQDSGAGRSCWKPSAWSSAPATTWR